MYLQNINEFSASKDRVLRLSKIIYDIIITANPYTAKFMFASVRNDKKQQISL